MAGFGATVHLGRDEVGMPTGRKRELTYNERLQLRPTLHRGDFRPGAVLPSPAFPPDACGAVSRTSRARGYEPRPQATPRSAVILTLLK